MRIGFHSGQRRPAGRFTAGSAATAVFAALSLTVFGGCGVTGDYANELKAPSRQTVSLVIVDEEIAVSPRRFGAGPAYFVMTNQKTEPLTVAVTGDRVQRGVEIGPGETTHFTVDLDPGLYSIDAEGSGLDPAELQVGDPRPSAQNELTRP